MGTWIRNTKTYIKNRWLALVVMVLWQAILYVTLAFEGVGIMRMMYPIVLSLAALVVFIGFDLYRTWRKDRILKEARENIDFTMENLPEATSIMEEDYQDLIEQLLQSKRQGMQQQMHKNNELTEFVTLWTHQVKTPLTALTLAANDMKTPEKAEFVNRLF